MVEKIKMYSALLLLFFLGSFNLLSSEGVKIEVLPGFSGSFKAGNWIPLTLLVESEYPSFEGLLEISISLGSLHLFERGSYTVRRRIHLNPGETGRIILSIPLERREELHIRLYRNTEVLADKTYPLSPYGYEGNTALLLSRRPDPGLQTGTDWYVLSAHPELLPISSEGYGSVSVIVIHDAPLNEMSPLQVSALTTWVREGGSLIFTGGMIGPDRIPTGLMELFPYFIHGKGALEESPALAYSAAYPLPEAGSYPVWLGELKAEAVPLGFPDIGTAVKRYEVPSFFFEALREEGRGRVAATLIDPFTVPYRDWEGVGEYWELLFSSVPDEQMGFPVKDPLPDLHEQLAGRLPDSALPLPLTAVWFLFPLVPLLIISFLKKRVRGILVSAVLLPLAASVGAGLLLPSEIPVYREFSLFRGSFGHDIGELWLKGGVTGREREELILPLKKNTGIVLPNLNERIIIKEEPGGTDLLVSLERWDSEEFFLATRVSAPFEMSVSRDGPEVSGFLTWKGDTDFINPLLIEGDADVDQAVLLPESGGLSFRVILSSGAAALSGQTEYLSDGEKGLLSAESGFLDYMISRELFPGEDADFYLLFFDRSRRTYIEPAESDNIGIGIILVEFDLDDILPAGGGE